ncbi:MAG: type II toxin-antitoxin system Phd/YefM family antitoxin [Polyangiaceae bacterium]
MISFLSRSLGPIDRRGTSIRRTDAGVALGVTLALGQNKGHIGHMQKRSFADVKAHLSEVVDQAEHRGRRILILRHGKPAAAIVPVSVARGDRGPRALRPANVERRLDELTSALSGDASHSAVADLLEGRR